MATLEDNAKRVVRALAYFLWISTQQKILVLQVPILHYSISTQQLSIPVLGQSTGVIAVPVAFVLSARTRIRLRSSADSHMQL